MYSKNVSVLFGIKRALQFYLKLLIHTPKLFIGFFENDKLLRLDSSFEGMYRVGTWFVNNTCMNNIRNTFDTSELTV